MKYLVTGGCGFIGSHLCDALASGGHSLRVLDDLSTGKREQLPANAELIVGDIVDRTVVARAMDGVDGCFHLAAIASVERSRLEWERTHAVNLSGAVNVFAAAARAAKPVPVVYASSAAIYGDNPDSPLTERSQPRPLTAYGADKLGCEQHARVASHIHRVPTVGLRFFNVYGPRQDPSSPYSGVISIFARRIADNQPITIFGDGGQSRDFIAVSDVVRYLEAAMRHADCAANVFNVCTGIATTVNALAHLLAELSGRESRITHAPARAGDIRTSLGDPAHAVSVLGVRAECNLRDGLSALLSYEGKNA